MWVSASPTRYPNNEAKARFFKRVIERVSTVPGAERLTASSQAWFGLLSFQFNIADDPLPGGDASVRYSSVAPEYFGVLKAQIREGRARAEDEREFLRRELEFAHENLRANEQTSKRCTDAAEP